MRNPTAASNPTQNPLVWDKLDFFFISIFACTSIISMVFWWRGVLPFAFLGGDAGLYASYAAALSDPTAFAKDATLFKAENFSVFNILHQPLILFMKDIFGDFGTGYLAMLAPGIFIQMLGFYLLGRNLFKLKIPALFLALISLGKVDLGVDYWGVIPDYEPRMLYQSLLPFVLLAIVKFGKNPHRWPPLLAVQGLLVWAHPPSAPPVALATLIGLFCYAPVSWTLARQLKWAFISGLVFLAVCSPFVVSFSEERSHGEIADYSKMINIYRSFLGVYYLDAIKHLKLYTESLTFRYFLFPWFVIGTLGAWFCAGTQKRDVTFLVVTVLTLAISSTAIAWLDQVRSETTQSLPLFYDMIRAFRLVVPFMLVLAVWGTSLWFGKYGRSASIISVMSVSLLWLGFNRPGSIPFRATLDCFNKGEILCIKDHMKYDLPTLEFLRRDIPRGSLILPILGNAHAVNFVQAIRYYSYKPLVYSYKDGNMIFYGNHDFLEEWLDRRSAIKKIKSEPLGKKKLQKIFTLAKKSRAEFVVTDFLIPDGLASIIGQKLGKFEKFSVIRVKQKR